MSPVGKAGCTICCANCCWAIIACACSFDLIDCSAEVFASPLAFSPGTTGGMIPDSWSVACMSQSLAPTSASSCS